MLPRPSRRPRRSASLVHPRTPMLPRPSRRPRRSASLARRKHPRTPMLPRRSASLAHPRHRKRPSPTSPTQGPSTTTRPTSLLRLRSLPCTVRPSRMTSRPSSVSRAALVSTSRWRASGSRRPGRPWLPPPLGFGHFSSFYSFFIFLFIKLISLLNILICER
jgi:hypothetical protein